MNFSEIKRLRLSATSSGTSIVFKFRFRGADHKFTLTYYDDIIWIRNSFMIATMGRGIPALPQIFGTGSDDREKMWKELVLPRILEFEKTGVLQENRRKTLNKRYKKKIDLLIQECLKVGISKDEISLMIDENLTKSIVEG